jgi:hypothetical protein
MRRSEFVRRRKEASCGVRGELLNRWSRLRILRRHHFQCASSADWSEKAFG